MTSWPEPEYPYRTKRLPARPLTFLQKNPMIEKKKEPRRPILTRKEQALLAFILALLVVGGIVRKLRTDWGAIHPPPVQKS